MNALLISDLHFTDLPRDKYRWNLFPWLIEAIPKHEVKNLFILGDLTNEKDRHPARLVNRIVTNLILLYRQTGLHGIYILRGNHDAIDPHNAYFQFLGYYPCIRFISTPFAFPLHGREILMLPHTRDPLMDWKGVEMGKCDTLLMHATMKGAVAENGMALDGVPHGLIQTARNADIFSGDIHVPQTMVCGKVDVEYVGAPYPIRFGDTFKPRAILLTPKGGQSVEIPSISKHKIKLFATQHYFAEFFDAVCAGDQVKIVICLRPEEYGDWAEMVKGCKAICKEIGAELCAVELEKVQDAPGTKKMPGTGPQTAQVGRTSEQVITDYGRANNLAAPILAAGKRLLNGDKGERIELPRRGGTNSG